MRAAGGRPRPGEGWAAWAPTPSPHALAALTCHGLRPQIDSFELLYYYDEYLGHSMW